MEDDDSEELTGYIPTFPEWECGDCLLLFAHGRPTECPCDAVGCNERLAESE